MPAGAAAQERALPLGRDMAATPQTQSRRRMGSALGAQGGLAAQRGSMDEDEQGEDGGAHGLHAPGGSCTSPSYTEVAELQMRLFNVLNGPHNMQMLTASINQVEALSLSRSQLSAHVRCLRTVFVSLCARKRLHGGLC